MLGVISEGITKQLDIKKSAKETWEILCKKNVGVDRVIMAKIQSLRKQFETLMMSDDETVTDFAGKLLKLSLRWEVLMKLLDLSSSMRTRSRIVESKEMSRFFWPMQWEKSRSRMAKALVEEVTVMEEAVVEVEEEDMAKGVMITMTKRSPTTSPRDKKERNNIADIDEKEPSALLMVVFEGPNDVLLQGVKQEQLEEGLWYLDTGASNHLTCDRSFFQELNEYAVGCVRFGDGSRTAICGRRSILLKRKDG
ncbi:uncharacterized protein LOC144713958 [Wolffia australiana]